MSVAETLSESTTIADQSPGSIERRGWLWSLLVVVALVESVGALSAVPILFGDTSEIPGPGLGGWIVTLGIAVRPLFAVPALALAFKGRLAGCILALAGVTLVNWLSLSPSVASHGLGFEGSGSAYSSAHFLISPLTAIGAALLVWNKPRRLDAAGIVVSGPTLLDVLGTLAFALSVAIYGF